LGLGAVERAESGDVDVGDGATFAKRLARRGLDDGAEGIQRVDDCFEDAGNGVERGVVTREVGGVGEARLRFFEGQAGTDAGRLQVEGTLQQFLPARAGAVERPTGESQVPSPVS
jgi:hypothetical protein